MNNLSLYEITDKIMELMNKEELTEEETKELNEELVRNLQTKSTNIIGYAKNTESLINAMKAEEERLSNLRKTAESRLEKFKEYVKNNMEKLGIKKITTELGNLNIASNPVSVEIENEDLVPDEFKKKVETIKIDKTAIKNHFKETGEIVEGTKMITEKTSLRIK